MYNSILVGGLVKLWNVFSNSYNNSVLKKIIDKIMTFISYLFQYSIVKSIFVSKDSLILKSRFYSGLSKLLIFVDKVFQKIHSFFMGKSGASLVYKNMTNLFKDNIQIIKTISVFIVSLSLGIILNNVFIFQNDLYRGYIISVVLIFVGTFITIIANSYREILDNSLMWSFLSGLFTIDEGGENWW